MKIMIRHIRKLSYINNIRLLSTKRDLVIIPKEKKDFTIPEKEKEGKIIETTDTDEKIFYHIPGNEKGLPHPWEIE